MHERPPNADERGRLGGHQFLPTVWPRSLHPDEVNASSTNEQCERERPVDHSHRKPASQGGRLVHRPQSTAHNRRLRMVIAILHPLKLVNLSPGRLGCDPGEVVVEDTESRAAQRLLGGGAECPKTSGADRVYSLV